MTFILPENPVSVPSRGEWGFLPQSVVGYDLKPDMFPSPREETGGSNMNLDNELLHAVQFPYPHEVNGDSYARKLKQQRKTSVSVPSRGEWGF